MNLPEECSDRGRTHVIGGSSGDQWFPSAWGGVELQKGVFECIVDFENGSLVTASVAVVWCREDRDDIAFL